MATENQIKVTKIADCLFSFKLSDSMIVGLEIGAEEFRKRCNDAAALLGIDVDTGVPLDDLYDSATVLLSREHANSILEIADKISNFVSRAAAAGFIPPANPMLEIIEFNETRSLHKQPSGIGSRIFPSFLDPKISDDVIFNIKIFQELIKKEENGELNLTGKSNKPALNSAQISSYAISFAGYDIATTGEGSDILSFLPDADMIKRRRIREALGALNFANREPRVLFTSNYDPDGISKGCILAWIKIPDASGYKIKRHDLFSGEDVEFQLSNSMLEVHFDSIKDYVNEWALSFYDVQESRIYAFLDDSIKKDNIYTYTIKAYQRVRTDKNFAFNTEVASFILSPLQLNDIKLEMNNHALNTLGKTFPDATADDISPYPFLSKKFYGHDKFDWILAATNVKASIDRGDKRSIVRSFSYLGAKLSFLSDSITQNKFYRPIDPNLVTENIKESIKIYGLSQTIIEIIESTGLSFFFGTRESPQEDTFKRATSVIGFDELDEINVILSSIDPETATVDVNTLTNNLVNMIRDNKTNGIDETSLSIEIPVPNESNEIADDPLQFVSKFDPKEEILDLATFEGISDFIRIIRLFFDMVPNRLSFAPTEFIDRPLRPTDEQTDRFGKDSFGSNVTNNIIGAISDGTSGGGSNG